MSGQTEFKCPACGIFFGTDLDEGEVRFCPFCGYQRPERVTVVENRMLCSACAGERLEPKTQAELEIEFCSELRQAFGMPDPSSR
jgi:DNA-directed RNA polymerase subunit RPC12/RpoP